MSEMVLSPKDPVEKGNFFYLLKDANIEATKRVNGICSQETYLDNSRMTDLAQFVGEVTDSHILDSLKSVEGFRKMVRYIGVSVMTKNPTELIDFCFRFYGKTDRYGTGTLLKATLPGTGEEYLIPLEGQEFSGDDACVGMMSFTYGEAGEIATATVRLYVYDGYDTPVPSEEAEVDFEGAAYRALIAKSLIQTGNSTRFMKFVEKVRNGEEVTVAFIGGSITQGAGAKPIAKNCYAKKTYDGLVALLEAKLGRDVRGQIHYVKAGIGGTSSELGVLRYETDVCKDGTVWPDLVVIEYAVNDAEDELEGGCFEALTRKALYSGKEPAVFLIFSVFLDDYNLQERLIPIGERYELPMVSLKNAVTEQFYHADSRVISKRQYFYDCFHPTNLGHRVMADCLLFNMEQLFGVEPAGEEPDKPMPVYSDLFEGVKLYDRNCIPESARIEPGAFTDRDQDLQAVERNLDSFTSPCFTENWKKTVGDGKPFVMEVMAKGIILIGKDSGNPDFGTAKFYIDGELRGQLDPHVNNWTHCSTRILLQEAESKLHRLEVRMEEGQEEKEFTILGIGIV